LPRRSPTSLVRRLARRPPGGVGTGAAATEADLLACYRLLLGREPDAEGLAHYAAELPSLSVEDLLRRFLNSTEFRSRPVVLATIGGADETIEAVAVDGFEILVRAHDQDIGRAIVKDRVYERHVTARMREHLGPGMTVVDIGANVGWFSLLGASVVGPGGHVHAIEANRRNSALLHRNVLRNGFEDRVTVHPVALSDAPATLLLAPQAGSNGIVDSGDRFAAQFDAEPVHATRLDDLLADVGRVDVLKMDIEGGEHRALLGMSGLLRRCRPQVFTEYSPALLREVSRVDPAAYLAAWGDLGYEASLLERDGQVVAVDLTASHLDKELEARGEDHVDLHLRPVG